MIGLSARELVHVFQDSFLANLKEIAGGVTAAQHGEDPEWAAIVDDLERELGQIPREVVLSVMAAAGALGQMVERNNMAIASALGLPSDA